MLGKTSRLESFMQYLNPRVSSIKFGVYHKVGIESTFMATPIFRYNRNSTIQFYNTDRGRELAEIFNGMGKIEFVDEPIKLEDSISIFGQKSVGDDYIHICKMYVNAHNMRHDNYIPWMNFTIKEILWAKKYLSKFKNPVCICPVTGQFNRDFKPENHPRMMSLVSWHNIVGELKNLGHEVLYFTKKDNLSPIADTFPVTDLSLRQMCALFKVSGIYIGLENGMHHGAVAAGATTFCFILDDINKYFWPNTVYTDDMWIHEPKRVNYYTFNEVDRFLADFKGKI